MGERIRVKICGITRGEDAQAADAAGADYLGAILTPGFVRSVDAKAAAAMMDGTAAVRVAVVVDETPEGAAAAARALRASVVQLHGDETRESVRRLRDLGDWMIWKAVRAADEAAVRRAVERYGEDVDGILVEGWREGVVGGGGVRLEVEPAAVRALVPETTTFVLAGGLGPDTVAEAVARFRPDVVDVSSGVEASRGVKDHARIRAFIEEAHRQGATLA